MAINLKKSRQYLQEFDFINLFVEELGWSNPPSKALVPFEVEGKTFYRRGVAELAGVMVLEITAADGVIPDAKLRVSLHKEIAKLYLENLLIFLDGERKQSLWYWVKREGNKQYRRDHLYVKGQSGDLFLSKLGALVVDLKDWDSGDITILNAARRLKESFDIDQVTKKFFNEFQALHRDFLGLIQGIDLDADRRHYASILLNRLMFVYFLQRKYFLDHGDEFYLENKLKASQQRGQNLFYREFLHTLFFEGFAKPEIDRPDAVKQKIGKIRYLNGGLFLEHEIERNNPNIQIADQAFEQVLGLFKRYSWNLDDTPGGKDDEINPDVLGYIFEKYINQKEFGAYYTRPEITEYLCDRTINKLILDKVAGESDSNLNEVLLRIDAEQCDRLLNQILPSLTLLDPACGSGAFLVAAMKTLIGVYATVVSQARRFVEVDHPHPLAPSPKEREGGQESEQEVYWEITPSLKAQMTEVARQFRKQPTTSEAILWQALRGRKLDGRKFRRQQVIGTFVVDFFCGQERLVVEVDGDVHQNQQEADRQRQELLESLGLRFVRVRSDLVEQDLPAVLSQIRAAFSLPSPALGKGLGVRENLTQWLNEANSHPSLDYYIKKRIITDNLYGVDIMQEATEIAKLRLFLALVASAKKVDELEPLPNIDFNIMAGNSLIGLIRVDEKGFDDLSKKSKGKAKKGFAHDPTQGNLLERTILQGNLLAGQDASVYRQILNEKNQSIAMYKEHAFLSDAQRHPDHRSQDASIAELRNQINQVNAESQGKLNELLLKEFSDNLGIKFEEAQLTGKPKKRVLNIDDINVLNPFHWGYHFDKVFERGGFDAIIANPPWEIFKPQAKEFFAHHSDLVTKNKMDIKTFEKEQKKLLESPEVAAAWLEYQSKFPYVSAYFRSAEDYKNQISIVNGKKAGTDINLYKLFLERCYHLLRHGGECGIVIPSGIYTDLGTKQLREMLFSETEITGLFCFENRKAIFEGVDSRFKFVVLTFQKLCPHPLAPSPKEGEGGQDPLSSSLAPLSRLGRGAGGEGHSFPTRFMRHDVAELTNFPTPDDIRLDIPLIRKLSPDSLSIMEFKDKINVQIAQKLFQFPLIGQWVEGEPLEFSREFMSTDDHHRFSEEEESLIVYEGKMFEQFNSRLEKPRWWMSLDSLKQTHFYDRGDWQYYRFAIRRIARNTDIRTLITTVLPKNSVVVHSVFVNVKNILPTNIALCLVSFMNSFVLDFALRNQVSANVSQFFIHQLPVPRLQKGDKWFDAIVTRAAKLICTTPEFDELAREVGLDPHPLAPSPKTGEGGQDRSHPFSPKKGEGGQDPLSSSLTPLSPLGRGAGGEGNYGVTNEIERGKLRAELDGIIAHIYGLTEEEFQYILTRFPIVPDPVKLNALNAYRDVERGLIKDKV